MNITLLKAKIHRATVTQADLDYVGSITIDSNLLAESGIMEYEMVAIADIDNGSRFITDALYERCHSEFPDVHFVDNEGGKGREKAEYVENAIHYSQNNGQLARGLAKCAVEADYLINTALMKGHVGQGVTLCGKNWYGMTSIHRDWRKNHHNNFDQNYSGKPKYMTFVDFMAHKHMGEKTMLFLIDGTYGSRLVDMAPSGPWKMPPFNGQWPSSLFMSQDGVAIDAVALEFLVSEFPDMADVNYSDMYLVEAALADNPPSGTVYSPSGDGKRARSLGMMEHWNNAIEKQYKDIELIYRTKAKPQHYAEDVTKSFINRFPDPDVIRWGSENNHFSWQAGYIMFAMEKLWRETNDSTYLNYIRRYVDQNVSQDGSVPNFSPRALDNFIPGYACLLMYELTGEERYAKAAETIRRGFDDYPRNKYGIFYHSKSIPQLWVDGVFMGQIFLSRYAKTLNHPEDFAEVVRQMQGLVRLCGRSDGLFYHGWAEQGKTRWAADADGHSPEVWSEGLGWTAVLFADVFDYLPNDIAGRDSLMTALQKMCQGLKACQDAKTGMWCQVVDKPTASGNWNETSGTAMFLYLLQKSVNKGYIPATEYQSVIDRAYNGLIKKAIRNADGNYNLIDCSSIGIQGSYDAYIRQPREISTYAAIGSFILGTGILEHGLHHCLPSTFYATDYTQGKIFRFDGGRISWQHDAPLSNDLQVLPNSHVLFTIGNGVLELNAQGDTVFHYQADCHVFACQRLSNGNTFIGECEHGRLLEVSPKGRIVSAVTILPKDHPTDDMAFMRNARRLDNGHYLVAHYGGEKVVEYDQRGRVVWSVSASGRPHSVIRLANGRTLVSIADADQNPRIVEYAPDGKVTWQLTNDDLAGRPLRFMSGMQYIEGLGLILTNWQGHRSGATQPHLLCVNRDKRILFSLPPTSGIRTLSSVYIP